MVEINLNTIKIKNPDTGQYEPLTSLQGDSVFIRYSANADGTDFTEVQQAGQYYIGIMTGIVPSENKEDYTWSYMRGVPGSSVQVQIKTWEESDA